jgi:hypothetical protein
MIYGVKIQLIFVSLIAKVEHSNTILAEFVLIFVLRALMMMDRSLIKGNVMSFALLLDIIEILKIIEVVNQFAHFLQLNIMLMILQ